jgi:predicted TIM-barrel fold metal-dependent hydrolase
MPATFDDMLAAGMRIERRSVEFAPEPEPRPRKYLLFSVDDHVCEPATLFTDRVPRQYAEAAPRVEGSAWLVNGVTRSWIGGDSTAGRVLRDQDDLERSLWYHEMRAGTYDIHARVRDMDIDGVYASLVFPSMVWGFCGQRISAQPDRDLALACVRAYNDWVHEEWAGPSPDRIIPASIPFLPDAELAAAEVRRNAERGFKAVHFSENPEKLGLPSIHTGYWDPFVRACAETGTVINIHLGSASTRPVLSSDTPVAATALMWPAQTMGAAADWVYSKIPARFPDVKLVLSEGGIGWVPMLRERMERYYRMRGEIQAWGPGPSPAELLLRNFWFCCIEEPISMEARHHIGTDKIMLEVDYPHSDTSWPDTQAQVDRMLTGLPANEVAQISHGNAAALYRHPIPTDPQWARPAQGAAK